MTFEQTLTITLSGIVLTGLFSAITLFISQLFSYKHLKAMHDNDLKSFLFKDKIESLKSLSKASNALLSSFCTAHVLQQKQTTDKDTHDAFIVQQRKLLNDFGTAYNLASLYLDNELSSQIDDRLSTMKITTLDANKAAEDFARLHAHILVFIKDEFKLSS
jgi:hypothetical protein